MRDSNHRSVLANRPVVTITSTVYDRRALDTNSNIPLINSLNHLTYLTSNSEKVRETLANDGALERLVSILQSCSIPLFQLLGRDLKHKSKHKHAQHIWKQKNLAMCAWKWTLAFQCLVLTGTRGTEQIRKKVVLSGVIPLLATVLDNYLIYHKNYDHFTGSTLDVDLSSLDSENAYYRLRNGPKESYEEYMEYITGKEPIRLSQDRNFICEELTRPAMTLPSDFVDIWCAHKFPLSHKESTKSCNREHTNNSSEHNNRNVNSVEEEILDKYHNEDCFFRLDDDEDHKLSISIPRDFFLGRIIPKQDDVIWSLQLLAFISKYTYMKQQLQKVELIESLSFRAILERVKTRAHSTSDEVREVSPSFSDDTVTNDATKDLTAENDPFMLELQGLVDACEELRKGQSVGDHIPIRNPYERFNLSITPAFNNSRIEQETQLVQDFKQNWKYTDLLIDLDDETWEYINSKISLNLFPLVERCTVSSENPHDMVYWSSVIMRNSCRKNELTGVRQCANFDCGKWEDYPRQFAKCRRCKRTKYCSRECQLKAWTYHRFWCHEGGTSIESSSTTGHSTPGSSQNSNVSTNMTRTQDTDMAIVNTLASGADGEERAAGIIEGMGVSIGTRGNERDINITANTDLVEINTNSMDIVENRDIVGQSRTESRNEIDSNQEDGLLATYNNEHSN